jgi:hypothetical protein
MKELTVLNQSILAQQNHRPWPLPKAAWVMKQVWEELLFAHWAWPAEALRPLIPAALELDTWEGQAYIGVVPFRMSGVRPRGLPAVPWLSAFPELNVRTYVKAGGKAGVYFFSLEAGNPVAVWVARNFFHLPYYNAAMTCHAQADSSIQYHSQRQHRGAPGATFVGRYGPTGQPFAAKAGTLEHWLTARYALFTQNRQGQLLRGEIHHVDWPLQPAQAQIELNTMTDPLGLTLPPNEPHLLYVQRIEVLVWRLVQV